MLKTQETNKKLIAIIPARGGSKRIPNKNIKDFNGKPIIVYSIEAALKSNLFDEVMVSTDDEIIAEIAIKHGAKVPFFRSKKNSNDFATLENVIEEVLNNYNNLNSKFDSFCCILPTAPLLKFNRLKESYNTFLLSDFDSLFPVLRFSYPIQRALKLFHGKIIMTEPQYIHTRSQDLEPMFHDAGQFYWMKIDAFMISKEIFSSNSGIIEMQELEIQDIDTLEDWKLAEVKYKILNDEY